MHSGFSNMRSALPMNIKAHYPGLQDPGPAPQADIDRIIAIWRECLDRPWRALSVRRQAGRGRRHVRAGLSRFLTYDVALDPHGQDYCKTIMAMPHMQEWIDAAKAEPDELEELDVEF